MSSQKLYIDLAVGGPASNAYSVTLASSDGSYGVKTEAGTVVVPSGTAVANPRTGRYEYTIDADDSSIYLVSWKIVYSQGDQPVYANQSVGPFSATESDIQVVADYRGSFLQGKMTTLMLKVTSFEGQATDPESLSVSIINENGDEVTSGTPDKITTGFYIFDWTIDAAQAIGPYTAIWSYQLNGQTFYSYQGVVVIADGDTAVGAYSPYSERIASIRMSLDYYLAQAQSIPVYDEEGVIGEDHQTVKFTFPRWNQNHRTRIYRNGKLVTGGVSINYFKGEVVFAEPMHDKYDRVSADYNFRWFPDEKLDRFLSSAVQIVNAAPPSSHRNLLSIEDKYIPAVLYGAAIDALRHLILDLSFQEPREVFGGPDEAAKIQSALEELKKNYEGTFKMLLEFKKVGPYKGLTKIISVPEYTLPGGRSRWFRYLMGGFNLS